MKYAFYIRAYIWKSFPFDLNIYADVHKTIQFGMTASPDKYAMQNAFFLEASFGARKKWLLQLKWHEQSMQNQ